MLNKDHVFSRKPQIYLKEQSIDADVQKKALDSYLPGEYSRVYVPF